MSPTGSTYPLCVAPPEQHRSVVRSGTDAVVHITIRLANWSTPTASVASRSTRSAQDKYPNRRQTAILESHTVGFLCRAGAAPVMDGRFCRCGWQDGAGIQA